MPKPLPPIIAALQLPPFRGGETPSMAWYEDYLLQNARVFIEGGIRAIKIQDQTREPGPAAPRTVARMAVLGRLFRHTFPDVSLGVIVQAHDAIAPLAIAEATDADFVRLKIFVGAAVNAEGVRQALCVDATTYRTAIARPGIRILADVHDRTSHPLVPVPNDTAALWAQALGADALIVTGSNFSDTLERVARARDAGVVRPIVIGGGVDAGNIARALAAADHVIVSTSLVSKTAGENDIVRWDKDAVRRLLDNANG